MGRMVITGGSRGIGAATAVAAAQAGWDVCLTYAEDEAAATAVAREVARAGRDVIVAKADVSAEADVVALFETVESVWGGLECLVNNAGIGPGYGPFESITAADLERTWAVNLTGPFLCAREAIRLMADDAVASIVNVGSRASTIGGANEWIHYAASKGGLDTFTLGLATELAPRGIRVNGVRPGLIEGGFGAWAPDERVDTFAARIPLGRAAAPSEIAAAIVWLASDAASYVTGSLLDVGGGR